MLILTRKPGEVIRIGDNITVTLLATKGNQARIGIDAPLAYSVHREEIYERILKENNATEIKDIHLEKIKEKSDG